MTVIPSFAHSLDTFSPSACVPDSVLGARDAAIDPGKVTRACVLGAETEQQNVDNDFLFKFQIMISQEARDEEQSF